MTARSSLGALVILTAFFLVPATVEAQPPPTIVTCDVLAATNDVSLTWNLNGSYFQIMIQVDGLTVATLPGTASSYTLTGLPPGNYVLCVAAVNAAGAILFPLSCCDAFIPGGGGIPITDYSCTPAAAANGIFVGWVNAAAYSSIDIEVDTVVVATLPGSATTHTLLGLTPGGHTICIQPYLGATPVLPPACCDVVVPGGAVSPIASLTCTPLATAPGIFLTWVNLGAYDSIRITVNGAVHDVIPGTQSIYGIVGLPAGVYTICVTPFVLGSPVLPEACCTYTIGGGGPVSQLNCLVGPAVPPNGALISWTNNGAYSAIEVILDGSLVEVLSGSDTSHLLGGLSSGAHTVCVRAFIGGVVQPPEPCCTFTIGSAAGPIGTLLCVLATAGAPQTVLLSWTNNGAYSSILVSLDGVTVATLPGSATSFLIPGVGPGVHVICVRPTLGAVLLGETCCQLTIDDPTPIDPLQCGPIPGAVGIFISWTNGGVYSSIDVELDGAVVATLAGGATTYLLGGTLSPGNHVICVIPYVAGSAILPPACCSFVESQRFVRGDANADALYNIADAIYLLTHLFSSGPAPACDDAGDANDDGNLNIADSIFILTNLFGGGPPPPAPHPFHGDDPTNADSLGCVSFPPGPP